MVPGTLIEGAEGAALRVARGDGAAPRVGIEALAPPNGSKGDARRALGTHAEAMCGAPPGGAWLCLAGFGVGLALPGRFRGASCALALAPPLVPSVPRTAGWFRPRRCRVQLVRRDGRDVSTLYGREGGGEVRICSRLRPRAPPQRPS